MHSVAALVPAPFRVWGFLLGCWIAAIGTPASAQTASPLAAAPASLTFSYQLGATALPAPQQINVTSVPAGASFTVAVAGSPANGAWLLVSATTARAPATLRVQVNPTGLAAGSYAATITLTGTAGAPPPVATVAVALTVVAAAPTITASPAALAFAYTTGSPVPHSSLTSTFILSSNGSPLSATVAVQGVTWLRVSPSGSISLVGLLSTITVTVDPTGLAPGTYSAQIRITAPASANRTLNVAVALTVNAALPLVTGTWPTGLSQNGPAASISLLGANFFANSTVSVTGLTTAATVTVTDAAAATATRTIYLPVYAPTATFLRVAMAAPMPSGAVGVAYTASLTPAGGTSPYNWTVTSGSLPPGLVIAGNVLIGTPTTAGTYYFTLGVSDSTLPFARFAYQQTQLTIYPAAETALRITGPALDAGTVLTPYTAVSLVAAGGTPPYSWSAIGLPPGMTLSAAGSLSGTPSTAGPTGPLTATSVSTAASLVTIPTTYQTAEGHLRFGVTTPAPGGGVSNEASLSIFGSSPQITAVLNSASFRQGQVSPGEIITIFGLGLGPQTLTLFDPTVPPIPSALPSTAPSTSVTVGGVSAPVLYTSANQVSVIVPYTVSGSSAPVVVTYNGVASQPFPLSLVAVNPGVYTIAASGTGQGAILNFNASTGDYTVNGASAPASRGQTIVIYATGVGAMSSNVVDQLIPASPDVTPVGTVTVQIGGQAATVTSAIAPPGSVPGLLQINAVVPNGTAAGAAIPVIVNVGGTDAQAGVTMNIR